LGEKAIEGKIILKWILWKWGRKAEAEQRREGSSDEHF
jgi:hypothetical protein